MRELAALSKVDAATEEGWTAGYADYSKEKEPGSERIQNPYEGGTKEHERWWSGYDQGYYTAHRQNGG